MTIFEIIGMGTKKYGGFERYIVEEARQLKERGYKLIVIFDRQPLAVEYIEDLRSLDCNVEILPQTSRIGFVKGFWTLLHKYRPFIVHTNFSSNLLLAFPLAALAGIKRRISTQHCLPTAETLKLKIAYQLSAWLSTNILAVSDMSAKSQQASTWFGKSKIKTLYLGVNDFCYDKTESRRMINISDDTIALMNIAYHNPVKGVDILLKAMNIIVNEYKIANLVLYQIGGGQTGLDTTELLNLAKELNIENNIVWLGIRNDVPRLLSAGDIYVQPSRSEGIPLSIMEASLAKLPVVATRVGGIPEAAKDGISAIIVDPESPRQLADAIIKLYKDKALRKTYGRHGRDIALEKFCIKTQVSKLLSDYYKV